MSDQTSINGIAVPPVALLVAATVLTVAAITAATVLAVTGHSDEATIARIVSPLITIAGTLFTSLLVVKVHQEVNSQATRRENVASETIAAKDAVIESLTAQVPKA
jgi:hypothetical protein